MEKRGKGETAIFSSSLSATGAGAVLCSRGLKVVAIELKEEGESGSAEGRSW